jgi:hypothetical protein
MLGIQKMLSLNPKIFCRHEMHEAHLVPAYLQQICLIEKRNSACTEHNHHIVGLFDVMLGHVALR